MGDVPRKVIRISSAANDSPGQQGFNCSNSLFEPCGSHFLLGGPDSGSASGLSWLKPLTPATAAPIPTDFRKLRRETFILILH